MQAKRMTAPRARASAGLLLFRWGAGSVLQVLLVHPGGPFWAKKDDGAWSIPKGELDDVEDALAAARREFAEETGFTPEGQFIELGAIKQPGGKVVHVWAVEGDFDPRALVCNTFEMEWPKNSGQIKSFPEVDHAAWFDLATAHRKILKGQAPFLDRLMNALRHDAQCNTDG
jgi:predicted NUDIX family NTP pyrophosphohydrolase